MNRLIGLALGAIIGYVTPCGAGALGVVPNPPEPNTPTVMVCPHEAPVPFRCIPWLRGTWAARMLVAEADRRPEPIKSVQAS